MATLDDIRGKVMLNDMQPHIVLLDPRAQLVEKQGQSGPYWVTTVEEDGKAREMSVGNPLAQAIQDLELNGPTQISIQRQGQGFSTKYAVSLVE